MTKIQLPRIRDGARAPWTRTSEVSPDLGDEWMNWRVDDIEPESDESAEEGSKKKRKKHLRYHKKAVGMSAETADS